MPCANDKNGVFPHSFCILCSPPSVTKWPFSYATVSLNTSKRTFVLCAINRECWRNFGMLNYWLLLSFSYHQCIPGSGKYLIWWFRADFCTLFSQLLFSIAVSFFHFFFFFFFVFSVLFFSSGVCISSFYVLRSFFYLCVCCCCSFFFSRSFVAKVNLFTALEWACNGVVLVSHSYAKHVKLRVIEKTR